MRDRVLAYKIRFWTETLKGIRRTHGAAYASKTALLTLRFVLRKNIASAACQKFSKVRRGKVFA